MKKNLAQIQYSRLAELFHKLNNRLNKNFSNGRFYQFTKHKQRRLLDRIEKIKAQLALLRKGIIAMTAGTALAVAASLYSTDSVAQVPTLGPEFRVNSTNTGLQIRSQIAIDLAGDFVITWASDGQDGDNYGIYAQRYNIYGVKQGPEFLVNTITSLIQNKPVIAMDATGNFVIAWMDNFLEGDFGIAAKRYNALGVPLGPEFRVNTTVIGDQIDPAIAMDRSGDFVITWTSQDLLLDSDIYARQYNADGSPKNIDFLVNTVYKINNQELPSIAIDDQGDFAIAWESDYATYPFSDVYAKRYAASGVEKAPEFQVNTYTTENQDQSSIAMDANGNFVITWSSANQLPTASKTAIAQRYDASGIAQGPEFIVVSVLTNAKQLQTKAAMDKTGDFVIVWQDLLSDGDGYGVYARSFNASGSATGTEFLVNSYTTDAQGFPAIAIDGSGDFVITWGSNQDQGIGANGFYGIYAQRYGLPKGAIPPLAINDTIRIENGEVGSVELALNDIANSSVLSNVFDIDHNRNNGLIQNSFYKSSLGDFKIDTDGILYYTPFKGFIGTDSIPYTIFDINNIESNIAYVYVEIIDKGGDKPELKSNTIMSPNADGLNDGLLIAYADLNKHSKLWILDEAGSEVYYTENYKNDWAGTDKKKALLTSGVYFFIYKEYDNNGNLERSYSNFCQIVR